MKRIDPQPSWPATWVRSYDFDRQEIYGEVRNRGYAYAYHNRMKATLALVESVAEPGSKVLDVAAAQGNFSLALAERGYDVTWNDLRDDLIGYVRLKHERGNISFLPGNLFDLPPRPEEELFDVLLMTEVIEHVAHPDQFLKCAAKLIRNGGWIIMTTPNGEYFHNKLPRFSDCPDPSVFESVQFKPDSDGHIFLLHSDEISTITDNCGLLLKKLSLFTNPLTAGYVKTEALLKVLPKSFVDHAEELSRALPNFIKRKICIQLGAALHKP